MNVSKGPHPASVQRNTGIHYTKKGQSLLGAQLLHKHENSYKCSVLKEFLFIPLFIYFALL